MPPRRVHDAPANDLAGFRTRRGVTRYRWRLARTRESGRPVRGELVDVVFALEDAYTAATVGTSSAADLGTARSSRRRWIATVGLRTRESGRAFVRESQIRRGGVSRHGRDHTYRHPTAAGRGHGSCHFLHELPRLGEEGRRVAVSHRSVNLAG
jgi:hypothetical protein